jgi:hypothetical protein
MPRHFLSYVIAVSLFAAVTTKAEDPPPPPPPPPGSGTPMGIAPVAPTPITETTTEPCTFSVYCNGMRAQGETVTQCTRTRVYFLETKDGVPVKRIQSETLSTPALPEEYSSEECEVRLAVPLALPPATPYVDPLTRCIASCGVLQNVDATAYTSCVDQCKKNAPVIAPSLANPQ